MKGAVALVILGLHAGMVLEAMILGRASPSLIALGAVFVCADVFVFLLVAEGPRAGHPEA